MYAKQWSFVVILAIFGYLGEFLDQKVNYGGLLLQALLEHWPRHYAVEEESELDGGVS